MAIDPELPGKLSQSGSKLMVAVSWEYYLAKTYSVANILQQ